MGLPLRRGRFFLESDGPGSPPVVVIDEVLAERYWPGENPIGKRISRGNPANPATVWFEVIGVVGHAAHEGLDADARVQYYFHYRQRPLSGGSLIVRTAGEPLSGVAALRQAVRDVDADMPLSGIASMEDLIDRSVGQRRLAMSLLAVFAFLGLLLAATGIYGVMAHMVTQRAQEMGLRMALGAGRRDVLSLVLGQGVKLAALGLALGVAGSIALTRVIESQLYNVRATDPLTFVTVTALLAVVGLVATMVPALRATRLDPVTALRQE
jgi:putative ABC transport system permease protein